MKNVKFDITSVEGSHPNKAIISIEGDLTLKNASSIKKEFLSLKNNYQSIEIMIGQSSTIDLSIIQLIFSLEKAYQSEKKEIKITPHLPDEIKILIQKAGFSKLFGYQ